MPCTNPKTAYEIIGETTKRGKKVIVWYRPDEKPYQELKIACRNCTKCRSKRSQEWAIRCYHESQLHDENSFITLTYDDEYLPYGRTLVKSHPQKFVRALRQKLNRDENRPEKIRYLMAAEYGTEKNRPHYHFIIFGYVPADRKFEYSNGDNRYYSSRLIEKLWGMGHVQVCDTSPATMKYVAGYVEKKRDHQKAQDVNPNTGLKYYERLISETGEIIDLEPEYGTMSLKPGIGADWFQKFKSDVYPDDFIVSKGGIINAVPGYYDTLLERSDPEQYEQIREARKAKAIAKTTLYDTTDGRLRSIDAVAKAKQKIKTPIGKGRYKNTSRGLTAEQLTQHYNASKK